MALNTRNRYIDGIGGTPWERGHRTVGADEVTLFVYFDDGGSGGAWTYQEERAFIRALGTWSAVANVTFVLTTDRRQADLIEYKGRTGDPPWPGAPPFTSDDGGTHEAPAGDPRQQLRGSYNTSADWTPAAMRPGGIAFELFIHEIGHALGLDHPHTTEGGTSIYPGVTARNPGGSNGLNNVLYTIMSYEEPFGNTSANRGSAATPMAFDIAAVQVMYGARVNNTGNDTYTLTDDMRAYSCIWDTGGNDTIVYNGSRNTTIDLRSAHFQNAPGGGGYVSQTADGRGGFTIAGDFTNFIANQGAEAGVIIENATGGSGNDRLFGNGAANTLRGNDGNDHLNGFGGSDTLIGGAGNDEYVVEQFGDIVVEAAGGGADKVYTTLSVYNMNVANRGANVEILQYVGTADAFEGVGNALNNILVGSDTSRDTLRGNDGNDALYGGGLRDFLYGGAGNDTLDGGDGGDRMYGGADNDTYQADQDGDWVIEYFGDGVDTIGTTQEIYDLNAANRGANVENLVFNGGGRFKGIGNGLDNTIVGGDFGTFGDWLIGNGGNDVLRGNAGNDLLEGGANNDDLDGGAGIDRMTGGTGDDRYWVDSAGDEVLEYAGSADGIDTILTTLTSFSLRSNPLIEGGVENLTYLGSANFTGTGNAFDNIITGGSGNDWLDGLVGNDTLFGGLGNDRLEGSLGSDTLYGEGGVDTAFYAFAAAAVALDLLTGGTGGEASGDTYYGVENVEGSNFGDTIAGDGGDNVLTGRDGNDTLRGRGGFDTLNGGAGNDTLRGDDGLDILDGGIGDDTLIVDFDFIVGGAGYDTVIADESTIAAGFEFNFQNFFAFDRITDIERVTGNDGNDTIDAGGLTVAVTLDGGRGVDALTGGLRDDILSGGDGDDTLQGGDGSDSLHGGENDDLLHGDANNDTLYGGFGKDTMYGGADDDALSGGENDDMMNGGSGNDFLQGDSGNDVLNGDAGKDSLRGGADSDAFAFSTGWGADTVEDFVRGVDKVDFRGVPGLVSSSQLTWSTSALGIIAAFAGNTILFVGHTSPLADSDILYFDPTIRGTEGDDTLTGTPQADTLEGLGGNDIIEGLAGNDTIHGGEGNDTLFGGPGVDTIYGDAGNDQLNVDSSDVVFGGVGFDTVNADASTIAAGFVFNVAGTEVEYVNGALGNDVINAAGVIGGVTLVGFGGDDILTGGAGSDALYGGEGADTLDSGASADLLVGGDGNDIIVGGDGADNMIGGDGDDLFNVDNFDTVRGGEGFDIANAAPSTIASGFIFNFLGTEIEYVNANLGNDVIDATGVTTTITIVGHAGDDTLTGGSGNDVIYGFEDDDVIYGGAGFDQLSGGAGNDIIFGGGGPDVLYFTDWLYGGEGDDTLYGSGDGVLVGEFGNDTIFAGVGDLVIGSEGDDAITSAGAMVMRLDVLDSGDDTVNGFVDGSDKIWFHSPLGITGIDQLTISDSAAGAVIAFGSSTITLSGIAANQLTASDFIF